MIITKDISLSQYDTQNGTTTLLAKFFCTSMKEMRVCLLRLNVDLFHGSSVINRLLEKSKKGLGLLWLASYQSRDWILDGHLLPSPCSICLCNLSKIN